jgi:hypothetical protein
MLRWFAALLSLALVVAGCGPTAPSARPSASARASASPSGAASGPTRIPLIIDVEDPVGTTRFLFGMLDGKNNSIGAPDLAVTVAFYDIAKSTTTPVASLPATFIWAIRDVRGIYEVTPTFTEAGDWIAEFTSSKGGLTERTQVQFPVAATSSAPAIGAKAPDTKSPTLADVGGDVKKISTDTSPDPAFYQVSVHDALAAGKPFVLVFATPAFCTSAQCGPTLDRVKAAAAAAPKDVEFINVEPYQLTYASGKLQPVLDANNQLQTVDATNKWGLVSEPWIFTVGSDGIIKGSFEGVVGDDELKAAIADIGG